MSKLLILNEKGSKNKYSIVEVKNIKHLEKHFGEPDVSDSISEEKARYQNIGVCTIYAQEMIKKNSTMQLIFIEICIKSIGRFKTSTENISQDDIAKEVGMSVRTVRKYIKELEAEGFIKINKSSHKTIGSGSFSSSYIPIFKQ